MHHPLWILVPWVVFALAAGLKAWRLMTLLRRQRLPLATSSERFREALERSWARDQRRP